MSECLVDDEVTVKGQVEAKSWRQLCPLDRLRNPLGGFVEAWIQVQ